MVTNSDTFLKVADSLEDHASSRANFDGLSENERKSVAQNLVIARSQAENTGGSTAQYRHEMRKKKNLYFYKCGHVGIDTDEAKAMWWSVVHDNPSPHARRDLI